MHGKLLELISAEAASASVARSAIAPGSANRWSAVGVRRASPGEIYSRLNSLPA